MFDASHPAITQLEIVPPSSHHAPPPFTSRVASPSASVLPFVNVNPSSTALLAIHAHRMAPGPIGPWPTIDVNAAPFTLLTVIPFVIATRFVMAPKTATPPPRRA